MPKLQLSKFVCDLCSTAETQQNDAKLPPHWISISIESQFDDRSFSDRYFCPDCVQKFKLAINEK
jgi:hypothetical protein